jgi:hypothetical protein
MAVCSRLHHNMCSDAVKFWRGRMEDWKSGNNNNGRGREEECMINKKKKNGWNGAHSADTNIIALTPS